MWSTDVGFGCKVVQTGPKRDKSGTFWDHISVSFVSVIWKYPGFIPVSGQSFHPWVRGHKSYLCLCGEWFIHQPCLSWWRCVCVSHWYVMIKERLSHTTSAHRVAHECTKLTTLCTWSNTLHGCQILHPNGVRLAPNGTNLGLFKISFSTFWFVLRSVSVHFKKSQIYPIWGQSDPIWMANLVGVYLD